MLKEFEEHFSLSLAKAKTRVWASDVKCHEKLAEDTGFLVETSICALGGEWPINPMAKLTHKRELLRLDQCVERLARARTLPLPAPKLALIVSSGCLSLLDFLNLPDPRPYVKLRTMVKDVFDLRPGAPEVVTCLLQKGSLDPHVRWLLAILRLWHHVPRERHEVEEIIESAKGRLGIGAVHAFRLGITISFEGFQVGERWLPARELWFVARKVLMAHIKEGQAKKLAERRPFVFGGLTGWNHKQHCRFLMASTPYHRMILLRLWSGAAMTQHKRQQLYAESPKCECGCEEQTLWHLFWNCPCYPPPPIALEFRKHLPRSQSVAHLLPMHADKTEIALWRQSCRRAVDILSREPSKTDTEERSVDTKGHEVGVNLTGTYAYCRKCYITRRIRDKKWIWTKRVQGEGFRATNHR